MFKDIDRMFGTFGLLRNRMDRLIGDFDRSLFYGTPSRMVSSMPKTNLVENSDSFEVQAIVPGISKDDLNIKIQGNYLEISGKRNSDNPEGYKVHRNERGSSTFSRSYTLSAEVDADMVDAVLKDGILQLTLPKKEGAKTRQITIN